VREEAVVVLRLDTGNLPQATQQASAAIGKIGQAGEVSARQTAAAMRQLPAQFTDVATQLAGGQNPLLILLQQGGQIKDSFGGVGAAVRGIGAAISPVAVGVGALAAVIGTLGLAAFQGVQESRQLEKSLLLSGNAAGLTASRFELLSEQVKAGSKQTIGGARDIVQALAATGTVGGKAIDSTAAAVARLADLTGKDSADIAKDFATMSSGVAKWAAEHNKAWNFITDEQYKYIKRLEDQGRAEEAMIATNEAFLRATEDQVRGLGLLSSAWRSVRELATGAWDAMLNIGRDGSTRQQLDIAMSRLDALGGNLQPKAREALEQRIQLLKEQLKLEGQQADARSRNASANREEIDRLRNAPAAARGSREKPYIPGEFQVLDARDGMVAAAAYEKELSRIEGFFNQQLFDQEQRDAKRLASEVEFLDNLREATRKSGLELIQDEQQRGEALVRLDQDIADRRAEAKGLSPGALEEARRLNAQRAENEIQRLTQRAGEGTYEDVKGALAAAFRDTNNPIKAFANALGNAVFSRLSARMADALATAAVGKDGTGGGLGDLLRLIGVAGGGISVDTGGIGTNNTGDSLPTRSGMATGTNYVPRNMLALVHRGEAIVPAKFNPYAGGNSGGAGGVTQIFNVAPGVSPAQMMAAVKQAQAEMLSDAARPGRRLNNAIAAGMA
jgi:phage-related minor tail protein